MEARVTDSRAIVLYPWHPLGLGTDLKFDDSSPSHILTLNERDFRRYAEVEKIVPVN